MQPETRVVKSIVAALEREAPGVICVKIHGSQYMPKGFPDLLIVLPGGETVYLEVKVPGRTDGPWGNGLQVAQLRWLWKLGAAGARCSYADSPAEALSFVLGLSRADD